jgi:glycerol-3-phosphate dehydrogenase
MAVTLRDVLARRWRLELANWRLTAQITPQIAGLMGPELGWSDGYGQQQVRDYRQKLMAFTQEAGLLFEQSATASL